MNGSTKRPSTPDINHRSTKRRKVKSAEQQPIYSTRAIPWREQLQLPERFHEHGKKYWPALRIIQERGSGKNRECLIEWEAHPGTGELFEPTWTSAKDINSPLRKEWAETKRKRAGGAGSASSSSVEVAYTRKVKTIPGVIPRKRTNRRIIPDSSGEAEDLDQQVLPEVARTLTPGGSIRSPDTSTVFEISETQQPEQDVLLTVQLPPPPSDKTDYESLRSTQLTEGCFDQSPHSIRSKPGTSDLGFSRTNSQQSNHQSLTPGSRNGSRPASALASRKVVARRHSKLPSRILHYHSSPAVASSTSINEAFLETSTRNSKSSAQPEHHWSQQSRSIDRQSSGDNAHLQFLTQESTHNDLHTIKDPDIQSFPNLPAGRPSKSNAPHLVSRQSASESPRFQTQVPLSISPSPILRNSTISSQENVQSHSPTSFNSRTRTMAARATRQSPRLQVVTPNLPSTSPRVAVRSTSVRARVGGTAPEISSPLAATAPEIPGNLSPIYDGNVSGHDALNGIGTLDYQDSGLHTIQPGSMHIDPTVVSINASAHSSADGGIFDTTALPIQESIEEEAVSSNEDGSLESKASSSQQSLEKEQLVRQQDGFIMPDFPILGQDEYCLALPAEGKVQAIYAQTIKVKRKAIIKFIRRRGSVNLAGTSANKTIERNNMIELIQRLHDTTTHIDLGLPGIPTQYTVPSSEHAAYADYAGSKFVFLGSLVDDLSRRDCTVAIMAQPATQDLIEEYLIMKHVNVSRYDRPSKVSRVPQSQTTALKVELLCTKADNIVNLDRKPVLVIAFDASFESTDPQLRHIRSLFPGQIPVLHLVVTNSSEHVERCLPASMPSPTRLKLLVRATYQAHANLGGPTTYVEDPADVPIGRPMDMLEFSKAIRKSPRRKLAMLAAIVANTALSDDFATHWTLKSMPELVLDELDDTPPSSKESRDTSVGHRARSQTPVPRSVTNTRGRSQTPMSSVGTPNSRKRLHEFDTSNDVSKKPRTTSSILSQNGDVEKLRHEVESLKRDLELVRAELVAEKAARQSVETAHLAAETKKREWQSSLAQLQRRYEKRTKKSHQLGKENKKLLVALDNGKSRVEKLNTENAALKAQLSEAKSSLNAAREDLKAAGGDIAALEIAREEGRAVTGKAAALEKSMASTKRDFEFVRGQYQDASNRAVELAGQVTELEKRNIILSKKASGEARRLMEMSAATGSAQHLAKIAQLEQEERHRDILLKKQEDELKILKRTRGVQTRGSSVQPGSPGPRSRQGSPAAGYLGPPSGSRASVLRHER